MSMPFWASCLEFSFYPLSTIFLYYYVKYVMETSKFKRTEAIEENANSWGRVDELRAINREIGRLGKILIFWLVVLMIVYATFTYFYAVPHSKGLI